MTARYIIGDTRAVLATLEPASVDLILSSPPFLALRSYLPAGHPDKAAEIGSEATPGAYIDTLLDVVEACTRVLAPHGSLVFELGDTYAGSGGAGGDYNPDGLRDGQPKFRQHNLYANHPAGGFGNGRPASSGASLGGVPMTGGKGWPLDRSLCLIPELFRVSLVYGFNPLTGRQTPRWRARNVIRWCRPNPPVGALGDKFRPATSELVVVCRNRRYFDLDAVRQPGTGPRSGETRNYVGDKLAQVRHGSPPHEYTAEMVAAGAPPLDWWKIPTQPYEGAHYATWPEQLCVIPIKAMSPARVCRTCGKPSQRIVERSEEYAAARAVIGDFNQRDRESGSLSGSRSVLVKAAGRDITCAENVTVGWSDCGHNNWRPGLILDPFAGSGTTLQVATGHGRDAIGIDLDESNAELALGRVGPLLLTVETVEAVA